MIKAAIEALDRATPGPWAVHPVKATVDGFDTGEPLPVCAMLWPTDKRTEEQTEANADLCAAAPQMAALIKRMVPYLQEYWQSIAQGLDVLKDGNPARLGDIEAIIKAATE